MVRRRQSRGLGGSRVYKGVHLGQAKRKSRIEDWTATVQKDQNIVEFYAMMQAQ
jgi:hypothetical protein